MKRIIVAATLAMCAFFVFSASTVSWEGRAAVGSTGIFPGRGMYGLSRVFSVGEIVEVYNPVNETKITVVISNNTDLSGILILLSPEAADALGITAGSDSVVRVSKIPEYTIEPVYGNSTWSAPVADTDLEPSAVETIPSADMFPIVEAVPVVKPDSVAEVVSVTEPELLPDVPVISEEVVATEPVITQLDKTVPVATITETVPVIVTTIPAEPVVVEQTPLETPFFTEPPPVIAENGTQIVPDPSATVEYIETVTYTLLPSDENPPIHTVPQDVPTMATEKSVEPVEPAEQIQPVSTVIETPLQSGAYYVQLAFLRDSENIQNLVNRYKSKYPIAVHKSNSGFQVLVGPLAQTECNAVLSQFKNNGFKDAFVKKIK